MKMYYAVSGSIRYYGQLPQTVQRDVADDSVVGEVRLWTAELDGYSSGFRSVILPSSEFLELGRRKEPPHEMLANLILDSASLYRFIKQWGFLQGIERWGPVQGGWGFQGVIDVESGRFRERPEHIEPYQQLLRKAWRGDSEAFEEMAKDISARVEVSPTGIQIQIAVTDLWNLVRLLFLRDRAAGKTKVCANKDCSSPYFLQQRRGQKYCTHKCAVLMNVRRFRERQAQRKSQRKRG